jgi:hypothetical protein
MTSDLGGVEGVGVCIYIYICVCVSLNDKLI